MLRVWLVPDYTTVLSIRILTSSNACRHQLLIIEGKGVIKDFTFIVLILSGCYPVTVGLTATG
jgi:hypothetical protein